MELNADFDLRVAVHADRMDWTPSPMPGVERKMLDRIGDEVARATTIVRFAPGSRFSPHTHDGGEEFLVLDGVFQDEQGDFPAGSYVRNPPTSRHTPGSAPGCTIFVKLWQFAPDDRNEVTRDTRDLDLQAPPGRPGVGSAILYEDARECVRIEQWAPGATVEVTPVGGLEILCLEGGFLEGGEGFAPGSWLRLPIGARLSAVAGKDGCRVWMKEGHLRFAGKDLPSR
ncbi:cupin domain-containing protein [Defluviimonas sp. D31]|uniref:cupin domain-containing protein n=1 Tax=Defluviimonas sp. D31 TaxID=3083253 RepID=UPI00296ED230|nr:cupin domain-containing protein [Defluviimonas sp. D31]MDW4549987.1 cupin domain-containing protein [Defluviimonas sp. D31]